MKNKMFLSAAVCSAMLSLSACEERKSTNTETVSIENDSINRTEAVSTESDNSNFRNVWNQESDEIKVKLERLREKAKLKGGQAEKDFNRKIDEWDKERKDFNFDETNADVKEGWKNFKSKVESAVDSLDKKI